MHCTQVNSASGEVLLGTLLIKVFSPERIELTVRAIIDPCFQSSFLLEYLCQRLRLKRIKVHAPVSGDGSEVVALGKKNVFFEPQPFFASNFEHQLEAMILRHVSALFFR